MKKNHFQSDQTEKSSKLRASGLDLNIFTIIGVDGTVVLYYHLTTTHPWASLAKYTLPTLLPGWFHSIQLRHTQR